jgi:ribosomal protein L11 methyltransferase
MTEPGPDAPAAPAAPEMETATWTALTTLPGPDGAEALGEALEALDPPPTGVGVWEVEDGAGLWEVGGYFGAPPDEVGLALLAAAHGARPFAVSEVPHQDWVAHVRRELTPVEAGRFHVHGSHDAETVPEGRIPLLIEAAMAFGTGHHGTTQGCLRALDRLLEEGASPRRVADVGCGTAVLAMAAAASLPGAEVVASDIDAVAVDVARVNLAVNGLEGRVALVETAGLDHPALAGPFDLVFANILKGPLVELAPAIGGALAPGGRAVLSGLLAEQAEAVAAAYRAEGLREEAREDLGEWSTLVLRKG